MNEKGKEWIDNASYEELLRRWRFSPTGGDLIFQGETGTYYAKIMFAKRDSCDHVRVSKIVGW